MQLRRHYLSKPLLSFYRRVMPAISRTEKEALNAGTVGWEGDLFSGKLDWNKLRSIAKPKLSVEEESFINGPLETLCGMIDDWDISHHKLDLPLNIWNFIREQGFFGLLIPKEYGGKGFSHYACSQIQIKIQARSVTLGTTVSVPNSLGPAELLLHYGTEEQKKHYLPRLAKGEEIPCFALTSSYAGSDATAMTDYG
ncbi:MAG TPA: acyl-CoA dehydrogenase family protein, partial [Gammaproteobacteria bacterium]|nr:acyl-CoA dehydrogenase family protein [Gammaproteobacteria bacterium]